MLNQRRANYLSRVLSRKWNKKNMRWVIWIATATVSLNFIILFFSFATINGFRTSILDEVREAVGELVIKPYGASNSTLLFPLISLSPRTLKDIHDLENIQSIIPTHYHPAILKKYNTVEGVLIKVLPENRIQDLFSKNTNKGRWENKETKVIIPHAISKKLGVNERDSLLILFMNQPLKIKKVQIAHVFPSNLDPIKDHIVYAARSLLKNIKDFDSNIHMYAVHLKNLEDMEKTKAELEALLPINIEVNTMHEQNPNLFQWLKTLDSNLYIVLFLVFFVCLVNIITSTLILIVERTQHIAIFKTLGATYRDMKSIFFNQSFHITFTGLLLGNIIAWGIFIFQKETHFFSLNPSLYFVDHVILKMDFMIYSIINICTLLLSLLGTLLPIYLLKKIKPTKIFEIVN